MTLSNQRITSTMMITPTIPMPPFRFMVFSFSTAWAGRSGRAGTQLARAGGLHRAFGRHVRIALWALGLPARPADVVPQVPELLACLVPGVPDLVLDVGAVDAARGLLEIGLDRAIRSLDLVHQTSSFQFVAEVMGCLLYTSPSPRDGLLSRMPSSA